MAVLSSQEIIGIAKQTAFGTIPSTPTTDYSLVPVAAGGFSASETFENIMDTGRRGSNAMDYQSYQGVGSTEITLEFPMMWGNDTGGVGTTGSVLGILLRNFLSTGTETASSGTAGGDNTPYRAEIVDGASGGTLANWNNWFRLRNRESAEYLAISRTLLGGNTTDAVYTDCRVTEISITANAGEGPVMVSASLIGQIASLDSNEVTPGYGTISDKVVLGWRNDLIATSSAIEGTAAGASSTPYQNILFGLDVYDTTVSNTKNRLISFDLTMSREGTPVYSLANSKEYQDIYLGPLEVTYSAVAQLDARDQARIRGFRTTAGDSSPNTRYNTRISFTQGTAYNDLTARALSIGIADSTPLEAPMEIDTSGAYATLSMSGRALATNDDLELSSADYDSTNAFDKSPVEIQITELGANNSDAPPTYS